MKILISLIFIIISMSANNMYRSTTKTSCIQQSAHAGKTLAQQKKILIEQAKQEALEELYGTLMFSSTDITNGKITGDEIRSRAVGAVRVKGNPKFYNGSNFGEICSDVTTYITKADLEKYSPREVKLKHFCYSDSNTPVSKIKPLAKKKAYIEAISQYKPSLNNISMAQAQKLIHGFKISNDSFDFDTGAYCFDAVATLLPYELEMSNIKKTKSQIVIAQEFDPNNLVSGLMATFYKESDYKMSKPIYKEYIQSLNLAYKKLPFNNKIKKGIAYRIKISGYLRSDNDTKEQMKLYADVYSAALYINDKKVLTHKKKKANVTIKKGFNSIRLVLKTANGYDTKLVSNLDEIYTQKIAN